MSERHESSTPEEIVLEALPDEIVASMETRDRWLAGLRYHTGAMEFLISDVQGWTPGQTVRVAFLGGSADLHAAIEGATGEITDAANLRLDFRTDGGFRTWSRQDRQYAAEIRVGFDQRGYFSLVGNDSVNPNIGPPAGPVGGHPHQLSLNLGGFDTARPSGWEGVVRHEFLHALAFHHEHQNRRGPCESAFRWEDDPGYQPTRDSRGVFVADATGRRPGIYTYLSGAPNFWPKAKVDHNLRSVREGGGIVAGTFDPASCMLYRFPASFYRTQPSPCAPTGDGLHLSQGDKEGLERLYPSRPQALKRIGERRAELAGLIEESVGAKGVAGFADGASPAIAVHIAEQLRAGLEHLE